MPNYQYCVFMYDINKQYLGKTNGFIDWTTSQLEINNINAKYISISITTVDDSTISINDYNKIILKK